MRVLKSEMLIPIIIYWLPTDSVHSPVSLALVTSWICAMCWSPQICSLPYYQLFCILWRHGCPQVRGGHLRIAPWRLIMSWILCWMQNMQSSLKDGCTYVQLRDNQRNTKNTNKYKVQLHPHAERRICNQVLIVGDNLITDPAVLNRCSNVGNFNIMKNLTQKENCENSDRNGTSDHQSLISIPGTTHLKKHLRSLESVLCLCTYKNAIFSKLPDEPCFPQSFHYIFEANCAMIHSWKFVFAWTDLDFYFKSRHSYTCSIKWTYRTIFFFWYPEYFSTQYLGTSEYFWVLLYTIPGVQKFSIRFVSIFLLFVLLGTWLVGRCRQTYLMFSTNLFHRKKRKTVLSNWPQVFRRTNKTAQTKPFISEATCSKRGQVVYEREKIKWQEKIWLELWVAFKAWFQKL